MVLVATMLLAGGCAVKFSQRSPWDIQQLQTLSDELEKFRTLAQLKSEEADQLRQSAGSSCACWTACSSTPAKPSCGRTPSRCWTRWRGS
ncbi:MAG: hypothetical protein HYY91_02605 [Candidatus Omnitrophica bacterium]|nr:hypothetical protein [Candidatus Omnitrophota bacterium]